MEEQKTCVPLLRVRSVRMGGGVPSICMISLISRWQGVDAGVKEDRGAGQVREGWG